MPLTHHADIEIVPGDYVEIDGVLQNADGTPMDLTNAALLWVMYDANGSIVFDQDTTFVTVLATTPKTTGNIKIIFQPDASKTLLPGRYSDAIRAVVSSIPSTLWVGNILADADPFSEAP